MGSGDSEADAHEVRARVKRKFERRDARHLDVTVECQGEAYEAVLEDISPNGLRIKCEDELPPRGSVSVHIPKGKGENDGELLLDGVLRWTNTVTEAGVELTGKQETF
jgi:hypothetical protein